MPQNRVQTGATKREKCMRTNLRSRLLTTTLFVGAVMASGTAFAQDADPASQPKTGIQSNDPAAPAAGISSQDAAPPAADNTTGDIVVTGTLIRNPNLIASSPITVVGQEELSLRQTNTAEQVLRDLPGNVASIGSAVNNGNGGSSYADLRGLGSFRNVVLLDGSRIAPSGLVGRVDLNNIPLALVERVDSLTGGAATTYGADAVSGVINFITRSDFSGVEANVSNQITERGDGAYFRADLTIGANMDDGRGNVVLSVGYQQADPVYQGDRDFSILALNSYTPNNLALAGSGTSVPSTISGTRPIDPATGQPSTNPAVLNGSLRQINPTTGQAVAAYAPYNFSPFNIFQTPFERYNIYAAGRYELADNIEVYSRGLFSKNTVETIIAPSGSFGVPIAVPLSNPYLPTALRNQLCAFNVAPAVDGVITGYTPRFTAAECAAAAVATDPNDPNFRTANVNLSRRTPEVGPRIGRYTTTIFDYKAGIRLGITDSINLDVSGAYGESELDNTSQNYTLNSRFQAAAYATSTTACLASGPGRPATAASIGAGSGCVPVNIFGPEGSINGAQTRYLTAESTTTIRTTLTQARALLSGDLGFTSPWAAEPVGFAAGAEYREYQASQRADSLAQANDLGGAGGASPNIDGGYKVYEGYGEIIAPLVADVPGFRSLTLEAGIRYSSYEIKTPTAPKFDTTTWKAGGSWEPFDGLKIRGNYQRAVRAPNISELFSPLNTVLTNLGTDPCAGSAPVTNAALRAVCLAQGAPASTIGSIENPTSGQANITTGGNLNLRPETSNSYTVGAVIQPNQIPGFSFAVDYYNIKVDGAITTPTVGDLVSACFNNLSTTSAACTSIRRNSVTGGLDGLPALAPGLFGVLSNLGVLQTDGIDLNVNYRRDLGFAKLNLSFQGNWTNRSQFQATPTSINRECVGFYSVNCSYTGSLQPEFSWNSRATFSFENVDFSVLWRHIDGFRQEPLDAEEGGAYYSGPVTALGGGNYDFARIKSADYIDIATRVGVTDNFDFTLTVTNLFDKDPPIVGSSAGSTSYNSGNTYPSTFDALGRRYAIGARLKF
jgi:outer membrane receptor protein involved in Fe transport